MCTECNCSTVNIQATPEFTEETIVATYHVTGMTCGHCASTVTGRIQRIDDVTSVDVDVATGAVTVHSEKAVDGDKIRVAIEDAGYALAPA